MNTASIPTFDTARVKCENGHAFSHRFCYLDDWACKCPKCGETVKHPAPPASSDAIEKDRQALRRWIANQNRVNLFNGNRRFAGSESVSVTKGFHPSEVDYIRKQMPKSQGCIKANGDVEFADRAEERTFQREYAAMAERHGGIPDPVADTVEV